MPTPSDKPGVEGLRALHGERHAERESPQGHRFVVGESVALTEGATDLTTDVLSRLQFEFTNLFGEGRA